MSEGFIGLCLLGIASLPLVLFDLTFLQSPLGAICVASLLCGCALSLFARIGLSLPHAWRRVSSTPAQTVRLDGISVAVCLVLASTLCLLGGEMHVFSPSSDWTVRDSILHDLVLSPWPVHYDLGGADFLLRAPLGLYLVPTAIGKILGLAAAHIALFAQNAAILTGLLILFTARCRSWKERLALLGVFTFFSGLDALPWAKAWLFGQTPPFDWHFEAWVEWLQYSSHITQLFWVPHHALAGWGFIAAYLTWRRGNLSAWSLISVFTLCVFWSPLAMMGALPFLCFALLSGLRAGTLKLRDAIGPGLVAASCLPAIAYLMMDSGAVEKKWLIWERNYPLHYVEFILVELVLWFWIFYIAPRPKDETFKTGDLLIAAVSLLLFPLYSISFSNDFTMRASIPALALVALAAAPRVESMLQIPGGRRIALIAGLAIAAMTPGVEIARALVMPNIALGNCTLIHAWKGWSHEAVGHPTPMTSYLAHADKGPVSVYLAKSERQLAEDTPCGPRIYAFPFLNHEANETKVDVADHNALPRQESPHGDQP
jgi:hypothetical protein